MGNEIPVINELFQKAVRVYVACRWSGEDVSSGTGAMSLVFIANGFSGLKLQRRPRNGGLRPFFVPLPPKQGQRVTICYLSLDSQLHLHHTSPWS